MSIFKRKKLFFFFKLDKSVITGIATGDPAAQNKSLIKIWCKKKTNTVRNPQEHIILQ